MFSHNIISISVLSGCPKNKTGQLTEGQILRQKEESFIRLTPQESSLMVVIYDDKPTPFQILTSTFLNCRAPKKKKNMGTFCWKSVATDQGLFVSPILVMKLMLMKWNSLPWCPLSQCHIWTLWALTEKCSAFLSGSTVSCWPWFTQNGKSSFKSNFQIEHFPGKFYSYCFHLLFWKLKKKKIVSCGFWKLV